MKKPNISRLTVSGLHQITGRDRRWITTRLAEKGVEPIAESARERLFQARQALEAIYAVEGLDPGQEQARLARARSEVAELQLRQLRGEVIQLAHVESAWTALCGGIRSQFFALPVALGEELAGTTTPADARRILDSAIRTVLTSLADAGVRIEKRAGSTAEPAEAEGGTR